tara:strand:+ start:238 stop:420 length:183 start_codon:yes stop_codon:yes gene_type:complete
MNDILIAYYIWSLLGLTVGLILHIGTPVKASLMTLLLAVVPIWVVLDLIIQWVSVPLLYE